MALYYHLLLLSSLLTTLTQPSTSKADSSATTATCSSEPGSPVIRFPFGLKSQQNSYPGFTLKCNHLSQTILTLPGSSGDFLVEGIDYETQALYIKDPTGCLPARYVTNNFTLSGTPYAASQPYYRSFTFLKCPSNFTSTSQSGFLRAVPCLSTRNYTVVALPTIRLSELVNEVAPCAVNMGSFVVAVPWPPWSDADTRLVWNEPDCRDCESRGGTCGFARGSGDSGLGVACSNLPSNGLSTKAKYGIALGAGIPGLVLITGIIICCLNGRLKISVWRRPQPDVVALAASTMPQRSVSVSGLDAPTIESYPKTLLGESKRLPKPSDDTTCPICLCEYQPKETLRTIPECDHFFHAECIDEWLMLNGTCPLCRNYPRASSRSTTAVSSLSLSSLASVY